MALAQEKEFTIYDIYALPDGTRSELIDGQIYYKAPPSLRHQEILLDVAIGINSYIKKKSGKCKVCITPFAVFLDESDRTYIEPDISVICNKTKLTEKGCNGAPDWIVEIVSPGSKKMDYATKLFKYRSAGVKEYWIVDPQKENVLVYMFNRAEGKEDFEEYTFTDEIPVWIYDGELKIKIDK